MDKPRVCFFCGGSGYDGGEVKDPLEELDEGPPPDEEKKKIEEFAKALKLGVH